MGTAQAVEEQSLDEWQQRSNQAQTSLLSAQALEVDCHSCHAKITFEPPEVAGDCAFCSTHLTAQAQTANPIMTPGGVLPFKIGRKEGRQRLTKWLSTRWFAPSSLKQLAQHESLTGIYLPFWTFDCQTQTRYRGERGTYYYVTRTRQVKNSDGEWETEEYQERHTRWQAVSGQVSRFFDDVLIPAMKTVDLNRLEDLGPWPLKQLVAYDASFLQGFRAQRYQVSLSTGFSQAKRVMGAHIDSSIRSDIGGDEQRIHSQNTSYRDETFKHILLPVWMATYRFKNQPYQVMINGESGKVVGDRPYCPFKIAGAITGALVAIGTIWGGYSYSQGDWQLPDWGAQPQSVMTSPPPSESAPPAETIQPTPPPAAEEAPSETPNPAFQKGLALAGQAANQTQTAQTRPEWQAVTTLWAQAIEQLKQVPSSDVNAAIAQQKIQEYQKNLNYARERLANAP